MLVVFTHSLKWHDQQAFNISEGIFLAAATSRLLSRPTTFPIGAASNPERPAMNGVPSPDRHSPLPSRTDTALHAKPDPAQQLPLLSTVHAFLVITALAA